MSSALCALILLCGLGASHAQIRTQQELDKMAAGLHVTYDVITNTKDTNSFQVEVTLQNDAEGVILSSGGSWEIHFTHVFMLEPDLMGIGGNKTVSVPGEAVLLTHIEGSHFYLRPSEGFVDLQPGGSRKIRMKGALWSVARTDVMPTWYLTSGDLNPRTIISTVGEQLSFVTAKTTPATWKRYNGDEYNPYTAQQRYSRNYVRRSSDVTELRVIPKPRHVTMEDVRKLQWIHLDFSWQIVYQRGLEKEADYLADRLQLRTTPEGQGGDTKVITLSLELGNTVDSREGYTLTSNVSSKRVDISGVSEAGVFYGVVTLLSLWHEEKGLPECSIQDSPRFEYRGVMIDVARNFHDKNEIIHLLNLMGRYKLNKLHIHLTDDEGWRLEIPSLPELTELGSRRCHDMTETRCLLPQLGSGPTMTHPGSGYITTAEYREILTEAVKLHIQVIPEFDMPGHARAAIKAMELRMQRLSKQGPIPPEYDVTLQEPGDTSRYTTPQAYTDNAINPCLNSTYNFVSIIMAAVINLHRDIQPLKTFHFGGDEVGKGAWVNSTTCNLLNSTGQLPGESPKWLFFQRVAEMAKQRGVSLGAWEDGVMQKGNTPFNLSSSQHPDMYAYSWDNVWEWGTAPRTYILANQGYKVVMAHGTHLYFDHPYEPDSEERGYYWATRFTDTKKTFSYNAKDVYANIAFRRSGQPITDQEKCHPDPEVKCTPLRKPENIMGMQASLFSETTRTKEQLHDRLFPRLLAMAERAWHEASWESVPKGPNHNKLLHQDWLSFVNTVGHRELPRLEQEGVAYRLPLPGAKLSFGRLLTSAIYPGLKVEYSLDFGQTWTVAGPLVDLGEDFKYRVWLRSRSLDGKRYSRTIVLFPDPPLPIASQPIIDYIASHVTVEFKVIDNFRTYGNGFYAARITLDNQGDEDVTKGNWAIYFTSVRLLESQFLSKGHRYVNHDTEIYFQHVNGYLFRLGPTAMFAGLGGQQSLRINIKIDGWSVSRYEQFPNWYVTAPGMAAKDIVNTRGESLDFVDPFDTPDQWKRAPNDQYSPWTPAARYNRNQELMTSSKDRPSPILPTPISLTQTNGSVSLTSRSWVILYGGESLKNVAEYLNDTLTTLVPGVDFSITKLSSQSASTPYTIQLKLGHVDAAKNVTNGNEAYRVKVDDRNNVIGIVSPSSAGVFRGVISLLQLALQPGKQGQITASNVVDWPRYEYRGMYVDVSRNFMPKDQILRLLDAMAMYKLNKFHIHLSDDEGWRLEIPGLPELTQMGSRRCHDLTETECIMSTLGSGASTENSGSGFYSVDDYKDILRHAQTRHIVVIPEFDMPGHSHAAVKAMRFRRERLLALGEPIEKAEEFLLDDLNDPSQYSSVQMYNDNAVNPCINSTYTFVVQLLTEVKSMHRDIQPLTVYHFGGDEVPSGTWQDSPACQDLLGAGVNLKEEFTRRVSALTSDLALGAWEDGLMHAGKPWQRNQLANKDVIGYAWDNVWEWGEGRRAYLLANAGYKVVLAPVTHLYFDHPNEPSPEERGFYWGTRYTDVFKAFSFMPDDYYMNIAVTILGNPITKAEVCAQHHGHGCPALEQSSNIIGLQAELWTETVRTPSQMDYMIFPRMLALAERAWHKAPWEGKTPEQRRPQLEADMARFAHTVGAVHLPLLGTLGIDYRVPPPGARQYGSNVLANTEFPGLKVMYKDDHSGWKPLTNQTTFAEGQEVTLKTLSHDEKRGSREVKVKMMVSIQYGSKVLANTEFPGLKVMYKDDHSGWKPLTNQTTFAEGQEVTLKTLSHDGKRGSREVKVKMMASMSGSNILTFSNVLLSLYISVCVVVRFVL